MKTGIGIGIGYGTFKKKAVVAYDVDALAYFARVTAAGGSLTTPEKNAANTLTLAMKAAGVWTNAVAVYPYLGGSAASCAQNLISASFTGTFNGAWIYSSAGAAPDGTNAYFNTTIEVWPTLPDTNSFSMSTYINTPAKTGAYQMGAIGGNGTYNLIGAHVVDATTGYYLNNTTTVTNVVDASSVTGFLATSRISAGEYRYYKSTTGTLITANSNSVAYLYPLLMGAGNGFGGTPNAYDTGRIAFGHIGSGMNDTLMVALATAVNTFQSTLGRA